MCRRSGLEKKRRCGWMGAEGAGGGPPVWGRGDVLLETCPTSYITAESLGLVEEFFVRRRLGWATGGELSARQVEAFTILEKAFATEMKNGQQNTRSVT